VPAPEEVLVLTVTQDGTSSSIGITDSEGNAFTGTLNDHTLTWSGSYPQDAPDGTAGTTTLNPMTATIDASCNTLTGNASWTWTATEGEPYSCSGTTTFTGTREPAIGCGTTTTTTTGSPTGVWEGTFTESGSGLSTDVAGIVQGDQIRLISEQLGETSAGTISVSGGDFTASMTDYDLGLPNGETTSLTNGTFTAGSVMSGSFNVTDGTSGTFSLTYDPVTDKGSSLAVIAGNWAGALLNITILNDGSLTGTSGTCGFQGAVSIIDAAVNIYGLSVTVSTCTGLDGSYNGYAVVSDTLGANDTLNVVVLNDNASLMLVDKLF
jgi:hypothetical protein